MQRNDSKNEKVEENIQKLRANPLAFFETALKCLRGDKYTIKNFSSSAFARELGLLDEANRCKPETLAAFEDLNIINPRRKK